MEEPASNSIAETSINQYHPGLGNGEGGGMASTLGEMAAMNNLSTDEIKRLEAKAKTVNEKLDENDSMPEVQPDPSKAINFEKKK